MREERLKKENEALTLLLSKKESQNKIYPNIQSRLYDYEQKQKVIKKYKKKVKNNNNETNLNNQFTDNDIEENQIDIKDAKPEFMSIFGEAKYGLEINKLDKKKNLKGLVGIGNIGNTCYMNTSLQCLSNCKILTDYFLYGYYIPFINRTNSIGSKGKIVESYAEVIKHSFFNL